MLRNVGRWIAYPLIAVAVTVAVAVGRLAQPRGPGERDLDRLMTRQRS